MKWIKGVPKEISIKVNYEPKTVKTKDYVIAKTKALQEFGYLSLTEEKVLDSINKIINGKPLNDVVDFFIKDDLIINI